jgi:hypothetical protein
VHPDAGRRWHYRDFYRPAGTPPAGTEPLWLVWGNCQAEALRQVLDAVPGRPYRTARIPPVHELQRCDLPYLEELLAHTAVLLTQPVRTGYRDLPIGVADLLERIPRRAAVLRWPVIRYAGLFPFQAIARHPADRSITPPGVPYHDLRTVAAARAGFGATEPWDADVTAEQIRAVAAASRHELEARERRDTDVGISDVLAHHGAEAAYTINHPGNPVLHDLACRLLAAGDVPATPTLIVEPLLDSAWSPLEARVIDALGIVAAPRPRWRLAGVELEPQQVHTTQLAWYYRYPDFVELTVRRHCAVMDILGLLGGRR